MTEETMEIEAEDTESQDEQQADDAAQEEEATTPPTCPKEILDAEKRVASAEAAWSDAKEVAKQAKERYDTEVMYMRAAVRKYAEPEGTLFSKEDPAGAVSLEVWRDTPISELDLPGKLPERLTEAGLTTVGALADWSAGGKALTDIEGVGPQKAEQIEEALTAFWARQPQTDNANDASDSEERVDSEAA